LLDLEILQKIRLGFCEQHNRYYTTFCDVPFVFLAVQGTAFVEFHPCFCYYVKK
jgi:hypothetical protein